MNATTATRPILDVTALVTAVLWLAGCAARLDDGVDCPLSCDAYPPVNLVRDCPVGDSQPRWNNLVLQGGGVKGIAYGGALEVLSERGHLTPIKEVAGTSAGAITATLLAIGYNACEVSHYAGHYPYPALKDGAGIREGARLIREFGLYKGDFFRCSMRCLVEDTLGDRDATFEDLAAKVDAGERNRHGRPLKKLHVVATDVSTADPIVLSHATRYAGMSIAEGVRMSMSIPLFFRAQVIDEEDGRHVIVDGGVVENYPIDLFDGPVDPADLEACLQRHPDAFERCATYGPTLGLHLSEGRRSHYETPDILAFARQLLSTSGAAQIDDLCGAPDDLARTVFIDSYQIEATDFELTPDQIRCLLRSGRTHMREFLDGPPVTRCPEFIQPTPDTVFVECPAGAAPEGADEGLE